MLFITKGYGLFFTNDDGPMGPSPTEPMGPSPEPVNRSPIEPGCTSDRSIRTGRSHTFLRWPRVSRSKPRSNRADATPTEPTDPAWFCHFCGPLSHFDKASAIFQFFYQSFCYIAATVLVHSSLLQCLVILATLLNHFCYIAQSFCDLVSHFPHQWWTQPFSLLCPVILATVLSNFMMLSVILLQ
jgi:hypothetical protein